MLHRKLRGATLRTQTCWLPLAGTAKLSEVSSLNHLTVTPSTAPLAVSSSAFSCTRPLLGRRFSTARTDVAHAVGLSTDAEELGSAVELHENNTINIGAVEEYSQEDMKLRTEQMIALYNPSLFAFCFYPSVDIVLLLHETDLLPALRPEASVAHWLADPHLVLRQPRVLPDVMGSERWDKFRGPLAELTENLTEFSPLVRCVQKFRLPKAKWLSCLRQLAAEEATTLDKTFIPAFCLSMCNGRLGDEWKLPSDPSQRTQVVCELLLSLAAETGALNIGTTACMVIRLHRIPMTFPLQKLLMCAFAAAHGRRQLDWDSRKNGALISAVVKWRQKYFKEVERDLDDAASGMSDLNIGSGDELAGGDEDDEEQAFDDDGEVIMRKKAKSEVEDDEDEEEEGGGDSLEAFEERNASSVGISADELLDDGFGDAMGDEGRKKGGRMVAAAGRKAPRRARGEEGSEDDEEEVDPESEEMAKLAAADSSLEGIGGGESVDEEYEDEEVFVDPTAAATGSVSSYFTTGTQLTRAQSLTTTTTSPAMERKQQKRNENMRRRLLGRITSQMVKKKGSMKSEALGTSKRIEKRNSKRKA